MSTRSQEVGTAVLHGIDALESGVHDSVHAGADSARHATKASSRWAAGQETSAIRKARMLKRDLRKQTTQLQRTVNDSVEMMGGKARSSVATTRRYVKHNPWTAMAIASGAVLLIGALLGRRR